MIKTMILDEAGKKIDQFNKIGVHYEAVYHYVIGRRLVTEDLFDSDFLDDITAGLISFDMQRMMGDHKYLIEGKKAWASLLKKVLHPHRPVLNRLRQKRLEYVDLISPSLPDKIISIYDDLAKAGTSGLNRIGKGRRFQVGASKILHFLVPDLFIILDSNARSELAKHHKFGRSKNDGYSYLRAMQFYQQELIEWSTQHDDPDFKKIIALDSSWKRFGGARSTPLPRIIDKCTFVGSEIYYGQ